MGLKTTNYTIQNLGITVPEANARIVHLNVHLDNTANALFEIQQSRAAIGVNKPLERCSLSCTIDKEAPIHAQVYTKAKETFFAGWEDDIVAQEVTSEPDDVPEQEPTPEQEPAPEQEVTV